MDDKRWDVLASEFISKHAFILLDYLAASRPREALEWKHWSISPLLGGANNWLYRATCNDEDLVIKWTIRDGRDRAGREFAALQALQAAGMAIAPTPVLLDRDRYPQPVVVQHYMPGNVSFLPPATQDEWHHLIAHYAAIHSLKQGNVAIELRPAVINMSSAAMGLQMIREQRDYVPPAARPPSLDTTIARLEQINFPSWPPPTLALCRVDANTTNFVRRPESWASVDWENSGWGDPVFELADLWTHPAYAAVPIEQRDWVVAMYCAQTGDPTTHERVRSYTVLMLIWWMARIARLLYEVPLGRDQRLVARSSDWATKTKRQYEEYTIQAGKMLERWGK